MHKDSFDFVFNAESDYYDLVVDKKIQKVVEHVCDWVQLLGGEGYRILPRLIRGNWFLKNDVV